VFVFFLHRKPPPWDRSRVCNMGREQHCMGGIVWWGSGEKCIV
jgi:hypothetical protein